ncbi:hypothetical protein D3C72_2267700 [compost metagenome]
MVMDVARSLAEPLGCLLGRQRLPGQRLDDLDSQRTLQKLLLLFVNRKYGTKGSVLILKIIHYSRLLDSDKSGWGFVLSCS